ncbi:MAG: hypothetical protein ABSD76_10490 [Terriglobales bacterium]|jgi:hypothetical protein
MRITVLGAILIVAAVAATVLLVLALNENRNGLNNQQNVGTPPDQPLQRRTGA